MRRTPDVGSAVAVAVVACSLTAVPLGATVRPPTLSSSVTRLANGLTVVLSEDHSTPIVHLQLWYHVGAKNEPRGRTGFAHLFEHLMFQGSKNVAPEEHGSMIAAIGGQSNAYTTSDETVFWETVPAQDLPLALWLEADRMASLRVEARDFVQEREVVKEERRLRLDGAPYGRLQEIIYQQAFTTHPYRHAPIGSPADLDAASIDDVRQFHRTFYVPENATLVLVGDFDSDQARGLVSQYFARVPKAERAVPRDRPQEPPQAGERRVTVEAPWPLPAVVVAQHIPADGDADTSALRMAARLLVGGERSRLQRRLVTRERIAAAAFGEARFAEDPGLFYAVALVAPGRTAEEAAAALTAELDRLAEEPVVDAELTLARQEAARDFVLARESNRQKATQLAHAAVRLRDAAAADQEFDLVQAVSAADVQRVARAHLGAGTRVVITVVPAREGSAP